MSLRLDGFVDLSAHVGDGGFDHAAVDRERQRLFVAHTANDAIDVIDVRTRTCLESIPGQPGVAGALVAEELGLVFTSNRGDDTVAIVEAAGLRSIATIPVGRRPNGLAFDAVRRTLLVANVGEAGDPASHTLSIVDIDRAQLAGSIRVGGRTRWTVFDPVTDRFFVNIADPPSIVLVDGADPTRVSRTIPVAAAGPHGLEIDESGRLLCACDAGRLLVLAPPSYDVVADLPLAGSPDVVMLDRGSDRLYVAIGEPGLIDVFDVARLERLESVATERGAHTIALDADRRRVYAFLPGTHRAAVFADD